MMSPHSLALIPNLLAISRLWQQGGLGGAGIVLCFLNKSKRLLPFIAMTGTLLLAPTTVFGEIYKWIDEAGRTHYSQDKPAAVETVEVLDIQESYALPPPAQREELERVQELTRQLQTEREAREQQRATERMLALVAEQAQLQPEMQEEAGDSYSYFPYYPYAYPYTRKRWHHCRPYPDRRYLDCNRRSAKGQVFLQGSVKAGSAQLFLQFGSQSLRDSHFSQRLHDYPGKESHGKPWRKRPIERHTSYPELRSKSAPKTRGSIPTNSQQRLRPTTEYRPGIAATVPRR